MHLFTPDFKSSQPIYEQLIAQTKEYILKGWLKPNDPMPSIRQLATTINVNPNTVAKAYKELERQGIIVTVRGKGAFISDSTPVAESLSPYKERLKPVIAEMLLATGDRNQVIKAVNEILDSLQQERKGE